MRVLYERASYYWIAAWEDYRVTTTLSLPQKTLSFVNKTYELLLDSMKNYNARVDLLDYTLERQGKGTVPPYTVGEIEKIEMAFCRIYDGLVDTEVLLCLFEKNFEVDFMGLLRSQLQDKHSSVEYLLKVVHENPTIEMVQDLIILESQIYEGLVGDLS